MKAKEVRTAIRELEEGCLFLARLNVCVSEGLFLRPGAPRRLLSDVGARAAPDASARDLLDMAKQRLTQIVAHDFAKRLRLEFDESKHGPFKALRVVTEETFLAWYALARSTTGEALKREPDHLASPAAMGPIGPDTRDDTQLLGTIRLCEPHGKAYVTEHAEWREFVDGQPNRADASFDWIGFPAAAPTNVVALVIRDDVELGWATCHRPTLLDAFDHTWWWCWPNDPKHHGHAVQISSLARRTMDRGAREWVVDPVDIDTTDGRVHAVELGPITKGTSRHLQPKAWEWFVEVATRHS